MNKIRKGQKEERRMKRKLEKMLKKSRLLNKRHPNGNHLKVTIIS
jgi:hypothetical protein